jgi:hypothetical protein
MERDETTESRGICNGIRSGFCVGIAQNPELPALAPPLFSKSRKPKFDF